MHTTNKHIVEQYFSKIWIVTKISQQIKIWKKKSHLPNLAWRMSIWTTHPTPAKKTKARVPIWNKRNKSNNIKQGARNNNNMCVAERYLSEQGLATLNKKSSCLEQGAIVVLSKRSCKVTMSNKKNNNVEQKEQQCWTRRAIEQ